MEQARTAPKRDEIEALLEYPWPYCTLCYEDVILDDDSAHCPCCHRSWHLNSGHYTNGEPDPDEEPCKHETEAAREVTS